MVQAQDPQLNGVQRSRKWALAKSSLAIATVGAIAAELMAFFLAVETILTGEVWREFSIAVLYWWLFVDMAVLSGYGIANVIEKWAPRGG